MTIYLYLKTHQYTGMKYLGMTTQDPFKYKGSGTYWNYHLKKYGNKVLTQILLKTECYDDFISTAKFFNKIFDVVESPEFANLIPELGQQGGFTGQRLSEKHKRNISKSRKGKPIPSIKGKKHHTNILGVSEETKSKISNSLKNREFTNNHKTNISISKTKKEVFHFYKEGISELLNQSQFRIKYQYSHSSVSRLVNGKIKSYKGWSILS